MAQDSPADAALLMSGQTKPVVVVPYQERWPADFEGIKARLDAYLSGTEIVGIEHVGSTSVPGLAAKPVIDVDVIVSAGNLQAAIAVLADEARTGYLYRGELGVPERHYFKLMRGAGPSQNVYVTVEGCQALRNHLGVRDVLRADAGLREEYGRVKTELAARGMRVDEYCEAKNDVLSRILEKAGMPEEEREAIRRVNVVKKGGEVGGLEAPATAAPAPSSTASAR